MATNIRISSRQKRTRDAANTARQRERRQPNSLVEVLVPGYQLKTIPGSPWPEVIKRPSATPTKGMTDD